MLCSVLLAASTAGHALAAALHVGTTLVYDLTPWRLDGILLGCWLAVGLRRDGWLRLPPLSLSHRRLALAAGVVAAVLLWPARGLPAGDAWVNAVGSAGAALTFALLLWALLLSPHGTLLRRLLEARPLASLGRISYGIYVVHFPIVLGLRTRWPAPDGSLRDCLTFFAAALALSVVAATVSWFSLERPILRLRPRT